MSNKIEKKKPDCRSPHKQLERMQQSGKSPEQWSLEAKLKREVAEVAKTKEELRQMAFQLVHRYAAHARAIGRTHLSAFGAHAAGITLRPWRSRATTRWRRRSRGRSGG